MTTMNQERMSNPFLVQVVRTALRWLPIEPGMRKKWMPLSASLSGVLNASVNQRKEATEPGVKEPQGFSVSTADNQREEATEPGVAEPQDVSASTVAKETTDMTNIKVRMITVDYSPKTQESNYMEQLTPQKLRDEQLKDADICPLITWMESGATPRDAAECQHSTAMVVSVPAETQRGSFVHHLGRGQRRWSMVVCGTCITERHADETVSRFSFWRSFGP